MRLAIRNNARYRTSTKARREERFVAFVWILICALALMRVVSAWRFPLSGDEAYYWEWSRRLALSYVDHPPLVAWTIALFDHGVRSALAIRFGFVLCGVLAALAAADFATRARRSRRAGALAALLVFCAPLASLTFSFATPDGPYLLCWCASLAFALRAMQSDRREWWIALGVALGGSILARFFGFALCLGMALAAIRAVRMRRVGASGPWITTVVALLVASPILIWNSENNWAGVQFAIVGRHAWHGFSVFRAAGTLAFAAIAGALFVAPFIVAALVRLPRMHETWAEIAFYSAAPLLGIVAVLAFFENAEIYWLAGPLISLLCAAAVLFAERPASLRAMAWCAVPSILIAFFAASLAMAPRSAVVALFNRLPLHISSSSAFEIYSYEDLARDLRKQYAGYALLTDGYGLSSLMDFYGEMPPIVVGYNQQGQEAVRWFHSQDPVAAIYLDPVSLDRRPDMLSRLRQACGAVSRRPELVYREAATLLHAYSVTVCRTFDERGLAELNRR